MQNPQRRNQRPVTYGKKSPRTKSNTDLILNTTGSEQINSRNASRQGLYRHPGNPSHDSHRISLKRSTSNTKYDLLSEENSTKVEVPGGTFPSSRREKMSYYLDQRKRKKLDFDEPPTILSDSTTPRNPSNNDNFPNFSSDNDLRKQSLVSADTAAGITASTRKRMVDSLGIMEQQMKEPTPLSTANGTTLDHSCTVREKDLDTNSYGSDTYDSSQQSAISSSTQSRNSRVTYARERSFLNDHSSVGSSKDEALSDSLTQNYRPERPRPSPQSRLYSHNDEDNNSGSVRGLHELRKAGENARFRSSVDSIFDDIEEAINSNLDPSNGFVQLCTKLLDPNSVRCFLNYGLERRFLQCIISDLDTVPASFALCTYELIRSSGLPSPTLLAPFLPALLDLSSRLIDLDDDILSLAIKHQGFVASKPVERVVWRLSSEIYGEQSALKISPRIVGLRCIQSVLSNCLETGGVISAITGALLGQLVSLLTSEIPLGPEKFPIHPECFQALVLTLSILEVSTTLLGSLADDSRDTYQPLSQLSRIFDMGEHCYGNDQYQHILVLYMRVVINITNNNPLLCETFSTPRLVSGLVSIIRKEFGEVPSETFSKGTMDAANAVILALGTLINLAEKCKTSRVIFLQTASDSSRLLDQLLAMFSVSINFVSEVDSLREMHHNVAVGYMSILLATLCLDREVCSVVQGSLNGRGLTIILSTVNEFLQYHYKVEQDLHISGTKGELIPGLTARLQDIVSNIDRSSEF